MRFVRLVIGTLPVVALAVSYAAGAQTTDHALDEVVVTASRIVRSGFNAPTPTTVVGAPQIQERGLTSVADMLNEIPSFAGSVTPSSSNTSSTEVGPNFLNLRGLGISRTLVLVNGRRHVPTNSGVAVDLNAIPTGLIDRVEVVTGGASAAWGSDAVAGVVNLVMRDDLNGFSSNVQYGQSERGDNEDYFASLSFGTRFADNRGYFSAATEYADNKGILDQTDRSWGAQRWAIIANPAFAPGNGQPARLIASDVSIALASAGGVIVGPPPLAGLGFGPGGTVFNHDYGSLRAGLYQVGGDGGSLSDGLSLKIPVERKNVFTRLTFDLADGLTAYGEASYAISEARHELVHWPDIAAIPIAADNAYLPTEVHDVMIAEGIGGFAMGRLNDDVGPMISGTESNTWRAVAGLSGRLAGDWGWDAYVQKGQSRVEISLDKNRIQSRFFQAIDAVVDPGSNDIVCRSTLANPGDGCVPFNVFGEGSTTQAALDYVSATQLSIVHRTQTAVAASLQGTAFSTWAGPVSVATGVEYREEEVRERVDENSAAGAFVIGNPQSLAGKYDVKEVFLESVLPLLADKPLAKTLDLNLASRLTDYSTSGDVTTWKAGLSWDLSDDLRLRGTRSRDIRAPSLPELYTSTKLSFGTVIDPFTNSQYLTQILASGNLALEPEEADTVSFGVVYQPSRLSGLHASVDYFDIEINGAIGTLDINDIVSRCHGGSTNLCSLIERSPTTNEISRLRLTSINLSALSTKGFDVEASYRFPLPNSADVTLRLLGTHVTESIFDDGQTAVDLAGQNGMLPGGGVPDWRLTASLDYEQGPLGWYLESRYISDGNLNNTYGPLDIDDNSIASVTYFNTSVRYAVFDDDSGRLEVYGVVNNLLDRDPPIAPRDFIQPVATNVGLYDVVGRSFSVGVRLGF